MIRPICFLAFGRFMPVTPSKRRKSAERGEPAERRFCRSCGAAVPAQARFCHACGTSLDAGPGGGKRSVRWLAGAGAAAGLIAVAVIAAVVLSERDGAPPPSSALPAPRFDPLPMTSPGGPPDLSKMAPREAADRLFNRIMMASEQGNQAEALRFVPMAI